MPARFIPWILSILIAILSGLYCIIGPGGHHVWLLCAVFVVFSVVGFMDLMQSHHAILRNYPLIGHLRFFFEFIRPEIRQYFLESDNEEIPFSRAQRALVYQRAKGASDKRPFGTLVDVYKPSAEILLQRGNPITPPSVESLRVRVGGSQCTQPYFISLFNISAMSFGALSANAIMALNRGAQKGGFAHDTGEGSVSIYHRKYGGDLIWEIGSGYFGCRNSSGQFDPEHFKATALDPQVKMIEIKLSQGAKPGHGGVLPASKITPEIAQARGVPMGEDCVSPANHSAFHTPKELCLFIQELRQLSNGKPVGFKLCIGNIADWFAIVKAMLETKIYPDFIVVDGSEGGTGAAPVEFVDNIGMPMRDGLRLVHSSLVGVGLRDQIRIGVSGKIISAFDIVRAIAIGADWCNSARGFMFAIGCIQSRSCHTDHCPTGVATQDRLRQGALNPMDKSERVYRFHHETLLAFAEMCAAAGIRDHQAITEDLILRRDTQAKLAPLAEQLIRIPAGALLTAQAEEILDSQMHGLGKQWSLAQASTW